MLNTYLFNGLITFDNKYPRNGRREHTQSFSSNNVGAVTTYATGNYINSNGVTVSGNKIVINTDGFFFSGVNTSGEKVSQISGGGFECLNLRQIRGAVIIHELLHALRRIPSDSNNPSQSMSNSETVRSACFPKSCE